MTYTLTDKAIEQRRQAGQARSPRKTLAARHNAVKGGSAKSPRKAASSRRNLGLRA